MGVGVLVAVGVGVFVAVGVGEFVGVGVSVGVGMSVGVGTGVSVAAGVEDTAEPVGTSASVILEALSPQPPARIASIKIIAVSLYFFIILYPIYEIE